MTAPDPCGAPTATDPRTVADPARWRPANEVERLLAVALTAKDLDRYVEVLTNAPLYLPGFTAPDRLLYTDYEGVRHLLAFTSVAGLYATAREMAEGWRGTTLVELVRSWPDPTWGLAVDPAAPIGVYITPEQLTELPLPAEPPLAPRDDTERLLHDALLVENLPAMLDILVTARVGVAVRETTAAGPDSRWAVDDLAGVPTVVVFTADRHPGPSVAVVDLVTVLRRWPAEARQLAVNPGTSLGLRFSRERIEDLLRFAAARAGQWAATPGPGPSGARPASEPSPPPATALPPDSRPRPPEADLPEPSTPEISAISDILRGS